MKPTVLITGASRGIGHATAIEFAKHGFNLVLICKKNIDMLNEAARHMEEYNVKCHTIQCDISNPTSVTDNISTYIEKNNITIDILVNNAGISHIGLIQDMSFNEWKSVIDTNLSSMFLLSRLVIPSMIKNGNGRIINISSMWGNVGASCEVAYSASKGGVNSFTRALSKELAPSNISVNAIAFGVIDTEMNQFLSSDERSSLMNDIPAGRFGSCEEAAEMIYSVATAPTYMTGQIITMDGGLT